MGTIISGSDLQGKKDGTTRWELKFVGETVGLPSNQIAILSQQTNSPTTLIRNSFEEGELEGVLVLKKIKSSELYVKSSNFDADISIALQSKSRIDAQPLAWAYQRLHSNIISSFMLDDECLVQMRSSYLNALTGIVWDIKNRAKVFYRKICDVYAISSECKSILELPKGSEQLSKTNFVGQFTLALLQNRAPKSYPHPSLKVN
jgi:hypothetical protein